MADTMQCSVLELDVGNTRLKWRGLSGEVKVAGGFLIRSEFSDDLACLQCLLERLRAEGVVGSLGLVRVASVAAASVEQAVRQWVADALGVPVQFARSSSVAAGVVNGYENHDALGVDRWLAILAAYRAVSDDVCVVDCGSAVTVDVVSGGRHLGGYIVPGLRLMNEALFGSTDGVKVSRATARREGKLSLGVNTADAVNLGLPAMVAGLVLDVCRRFENEFGRNVRVVMTGGDAPLVAELLQGELPEVLIEPDLVLDGLRLAL